VYQAHVQDATHLYILGVSVSFRDSL